MRKQILLVIIVTIFIFSFSSITFAENKIVENAGIKVFFEGKQFKVTDVSIIINNEILLPSIELLTKLGVKNDNKNIVWDKNKKSLTINSGKTNIILVMNSNKAIFNKSTITLNVAPVTYKGKNYLPVKSVAQLFGRKFAWEKVANSIYIKSEQEFKKTKDVLDKAVKISVAVNKYIAYRAWEPIFTNKDGSTSKSEYISNTKVDKSKMIMSSISGEDPPKDNYYIRNGILYTNDLVEKKWEKKTLSKKDLNDWILDNDISRYVISDILYNGLIMEYDNKTNTIRLYGNVYLYKKGETSFNDGSELINTYAEIIIDKKTNWINKITLKFNKTGNADSGFTLYNSTEINSYSNQAGDFELETLDESKMDFKENNDNQSNNPEITLSVDEESKIKALSLNIAKVPVDGAYSHPYNIDATQAIMFVIFKTQDDFDSYNGLRDEAKKVFFNQIVQDNYGSYVGCSTVFGIAFYNGKVYDSITTGYETAPQNVTLAMDKEGHVLKVYVQDKKNNNYSEYLGN